MAGAARKDHHPVAFLRVEIDSIDSASFRKCGGLKSESEVFEYQEGGDNDTVRKLIGPTKASNLVLTKGYISDPALFKWRDEIACWNFQKAWPVRWEMTEFDANTGQALCEVLELAVEKLSKG